MRSAFLAQGVLLVCLLGAAAVSYFMGTGDDTGFMFGGVGLATAAVMCLWSLTLSIRAARKGAAWRWAGVIWFLVGLELIAPEIFYWGTLERYPHDSLYEILGIGVALPFLFVTGMYIALAALLTRVFKRRRNAVLLALFLYLPFLLLITPGAVYLVAVHSTRSEVSSEAAIVLVESTPEFIRDGVDVFLSSFPPGRFFDYHLLLCERGRLSRRRTLENLSAPGATAIETWLSMQEYNKRESFEVALDIAMERIPHSPAMTPLDKSMGAMIVAWGDAEQVENVFKRYSNLPTGMRTGLVNMLESRDGLAVSIVFHRICTEREVLEALKVGMRRSNTVANSKAAQGPIGQILENWARIKSIQDPDMTRIQYKEIIATCRGGLTPEVVRRAGATALADLLKREVHHIPDALAKTADGKPVPVTLDETEEIEALCIAAEAEVAKLSQTSSETKP